MSYDNIYGPPKIGDFVKLVSTVRSAHTKICVTGVILEIADTQVKVQLDNNEQTKKLIAAFSWSNKRILEFDSTAQHHTIIVSIRNIKIIGRTYRSKLLRPPSYYLCTPDNIKSSWKECAWKPRHLR